MAEYQFVLFSLNNELCGVDTLQVQEIVKCNTLEKSDSMPQYADGLVNVRGEIIPVVDLNRKFELSDAESEKMSKVIISFVNKNFVGFAVNDVLGIVKLNDTDINPAHEVISKTKRSYLKGIGRSGDKLISILDLSKLLDDGEFVNKAAAD